MDEADGIHAGVDYPGVTRVIQVGIPTNRDIYIHRIGRTGRAGRAGRGDLVLLPWEARFRTSELYDLPISTFSVEEAKAELDLLARDRDESDSAPPVATLSPLMKTGMSRRAMSPLPRRGTTEMSIPVRPRLSSFETSLETSILPALDESLVQDAFASMIGFYLSKAETLNLRKTDVVKGLKDWATGGLRLEQEPYVSQAFLEKMGVRRDAPSGRAGGGYGAGKREGRTFFRDGAGYERRTGFRRREQDVRVEVFF